MITKSLPSGFIPGIEGGTLVLPDVTTPNQYTLSVLIDHNSISATLAYLIPDESAPHISEKVGNKTVAHIFSGTLQQIGNNIGETLCEIHSANKSMQRQIRNTVRKFINDTDLVASDLATKAMPARRSANNDLEFFSQLPDYLQKYLLHKVFLSTSNGLGESIQGEVVKNGNEFCFLLHSSESREGDPWDPSDYGTTPIVIDIKNNLIKRFEYNDEAHGKVCALRIINRDNDAVCVELQGGELKHCKVVENRKRLVDTNFARSDNPYIIYEYHNKNRKNRKSTQLSDGKALIHYTHGTMIFTQDQYEETFSTNRQLYFWLSKLAE